MKNDDLEKYCREIIDQGAEAAKVILPETVVTAPWVRFKCRYGCRSYGRKYSCPPETPTHHETRELLDSYERAILIHYAIQPDEAGRRKKVWKGLSDRLVETEGEIFKDGFYKALVFLAGPCGLCEECSKAKDEPCLFGRKMRPSMEACGIDVYQTARNNGFYIEPLLEKGESQNIYCLMLVD